MDELAVTNIQVGELLPKCNIDFKDQQHLQSLCTAKNFHQMSKYLAVQLEWRLK